jgi:hypothetical protein
MENNLGLNIWFARKKLLAFIQSDLFFLGLSLAFIILYIRFVYYATSITRPDFLLHFAFALTSAWFIAAWTLIAIKTYYKA